MAYKKTIWVEGETPISPRNMNNIEEGIEAQEAALDAHKADYVRQPAYATTGGTATAYTATLDPAPASIVEGFSITIVPHVDCGANPTLNINDKGVIQLRNSDNEQLSAGDLVAGRPYNFRKVGSYFFLSSVGGGVTVEFENYFSLLEPTLIRSSPTALSTAMPDLSGASVGDYAVFARGTTTDAYNKSLTRTSPNGLSVAMLSPASASVGDYALFGGSSGKKTLNAYDTSLTRSIRTDLTDGMHGETTGISAGNYALFSGTSAVDAYSTSLVKSSPQNLSSYRGYTGGATAGEYALFVGGRSGSTYYSTVDAYNASLIRSNPIGLTISSSMLPGASLGNYAIFCGGLSGPTCMDRAYAYDASLVRYTLSGISVARRSLKAASTKNFALFAGGILEDNTQSDVVEAYDDQLTRHIQTKMSVARGGFGAASIGKYVLFAGGSNSSSHLSSVDAYREDVKTFIPVSAGSKYKFTEATEQTASSSTTLTYNQAVTGYIKYKKGVISNG